MCCDLSAEFIPSAHKKENYPNRIVFFLNISGTN
jgi:hypothetical protein